LQQDSVENPSSFPRTHNTRTVHHRTSQVLNRVPVGFDSFASTGVNTAVTQGFKVKGALSQPNVRPRDEHAL
jgi:hypothetical protein